MNKQRKTSNILNVFQYDEVTGAVTLPSTLVLTAPDGSDNSTKVPTTAWTRSYVSGLSYLTGNQSITVSGDATGSGTTSINLTLANTAVTPGTYGSTTLVPVVTVDSKGRITNVTTAAISGSLSFTGDVTGTGTTGTSTGLTLANSGVTAGTYTKVTVDSKGRVTVGASATTTDIAEGTRLYYTDARVLAYLGANNYATQSYVSTQINNLVSGAPGLLDTLDELAASLGDDPNFATTVSTALGNRLRIDTAAQGLSGTQQSNGRTNLGLGTAATSAIGDFATAAQGTRADTAHGWGNHASAGYLTSATAATTYASLTGSYANPSWITSLAYSKITGVPAFLTSYTETDTLASVTGRGATTSNPIIVTASEGREVAVYMPSSYTTDDLVSGHEYGWYNDHWRLGMTRSGNSAGSDFVIQWNAARRLSLTNGGNLTVTGTISASNFSGSSSGTNTGDQTNISGNSATTSQTNFSSLTVNSNVVLHAGNFSSYALRWNSTQAPANGLDNTGIVPNSVTLFDGYAARVPGYPSGADQWWVGALTIGDASRGFQIAGGYADSDMYFRKGNNTWAAWRKVWTDVNLTNLNQLTNGPGYITAESDTLATVTSRGNTTNGSINVNGNILMTGTATTTNQARTIDFTGFDKEAVTDFSDRAYIQHTTNTGGHAGSVLVIASENDADDGIAFLTNASSKLKHNSNNIATESFVTSQGYITSSPLSSYLPLTGGSISGTLTTNGQLAVANNIVMYGDNKQIQWNAAASADLFISAIPGTRTIEIRNGNAASPNYAACGLITGYATFTSNVTVQGNITVSSSNTTGNGIILADDGDIVDLNDAYCSMRFSYGVRIYSANRGGSPVITLANTGVVTATTFSGALSGNATTASSISGFNNPTTAATANTIVYRDGSGDVAAREFVLTASTIHVDTPSSMLGIYPTTNQVVKFGSPAARNFLNVPTRTGGDASGTWGISISGNAATATYSSLDFRHSDRDFPTGTLVQTNINYAVSSGDAFILEIKGNSYFNTIPFDVQIQGYIYGDTIISTGGYSNGKYIDGIRAINHNGNLCFWWPSGGYWEGFNVKVYAAFASYPSNRVTSISNSAQPTTAKQVNFSPVQSLHSGNFNSYAPSLTGGNASGTWGINITGNAATATSATDSTKLPLAGGTLTGNLLFSNSGTGKRGIQGTCGDNDFWFIGGGATASNAGFLEIATGDDGQSAGAAEPIYVSQYGPGDVLTGTLFRRATLLDASGNTSFPGSLSIGGSVSIAGNVALHAGNYSSYTLPRGGSWYGVNTPGTRWGGFAVNGGEIVFGDGLPNANQMGILVDGAYLAGENNGFWSLPSDNNWNGRRGMFWDGTNLNFTTNSPRASFTSLVTTVGSGGASGNSTVVGLKIAGLNNYDSLELGTEDNYNAVIRTYGNDLKYYAGHWRSGTSSENHSHLWYTSRNGSSDWATVKMSLNHLGNLSVSGTVSSNGATLGCGVGTGRSGYAPETLNLVLLSSSSGSDGVSGIDFRSGNNYPSDGASIYYENSQTGSGEVSRLVFRTENDLNDSILMRAGYHVYNARTVDNASQGVDNPIFRWQYLDSNRMTLDSSGNLVCNGDVTAYSDARIKTNVHTIENALDKTLRMRGVSYNRTDGNDASTKIGVIAQEVIEILPEVVHEQSDGMLGVSYGNIVGVLIEAIKEQQKQIEDLTNKIDLLTQNK